MTVDDTAKYALRSATAADQPAIKEMIRHARLNPTGIRWPRFTVAVDLAGQIIGCGQIKTHRDGSRELASLVVRRQWRRHGVARAIFERLNQGPTHSLWLTCASPLTPFYGRLGFREVTDPRGMPLYFRFIKRFFPLMARLFGSRDYLAVMRYQR